MPALSNDLRQRIVTAYDRGEGTRQDIAHRFGVSLGMVKKLIQLKRHGGDISCRYHRSGRKPSILPAFGDKLTGLVQEDPDITLAEIREKLGMTCSLTSIHNALIKLGLTYKKRRSGPANKTAKT